MKKLLIGLILTTSSPFIVILGNYLITNFKISNETTTFACVLGSLSIIFNFIIGILLIIKGHQDLGTFKGWFKI